MSVKKQHTYDPNLVEVKAKVTKCFSPLLPVYSHTQAHTHTHTHTHKHTHTHTDPYES